MERPTRTARWGALLALGLVAVLGFTACGGGGGDDDGVASLGGDDPSSDGGASGEDEGGDDGGELSEDEIRDAQLDFAACMREHGIDMPDPQIDEDGRTVIQVGPGEGGEGGAAPDPEEMEAAQKECEHFLEKLRENAPEIDPEEQEEAKQQALDFAECMREQGVEDFPDPEFTDDGGIGQKVEEDAANDPDFEAAQEHCAQEIGGPFGERPRLNGGGGGGAEPEGAS